MNIDLSRLLDGGPLVWIGIGVIVLLMMRKNKDVGISNLIVDLLRQLLNAPEADDLIKDEQRVNAVVKLSNHLREKDDQKNADGILSFLPALTRRTGAKNDSEK